MHHDFEAVRRQLWDIPPTSTNTITSQCTPFALPSGGVITFENQAITLTENVIFQPACTGDWSPHIGDPSSVADLQDPFYASTIPQVYVVAAATVIAWILVIMLIITPRTSYLGHPGTAPNFSSGRGLIGGATGGGTNMIGVGSRPWLQKVAALTVAISLTIATYDTFKVSRGQYHNGYMDADALADGVLGSLEIRVTRIISDIFLWLAQVQTLIRLFPRHKEKVLIKWIGFCLIILDTTFACLNSFLVDNSRRPRQFVDAIPALSYLFELSLGLLYAAWVLYYAMTKRRYAFYHSKMRNIMLVGVLSVIAVLTPCVFFITDVSKPDVAAWGDYFRWVGAAAAAVVVWEWVERIEALERDEKKDGILGREIFDGDDMLDVTHSDAVVWSRNRRGRNPFGDSGNDEDDNDGGGGSGGLMGSSALESGINNMAQRLRHQKKNRQHHFPLGRAHSHATTLTPDNANTGGPHGNGPGNGNVAFGNLPRPSHGRRQGEAMVGGPTPPPQVASPVSRADTTSAASTVYVMHYHPVDEVSQPVRRRQEARNNNTAAAERLGRARDPEKEGTDEGQAHRSRPKDNHKWLAVPNPFKRKRASPPLEVQQASDPLSGEKTRAATPAHNFKPWDVKNRLGVLAAETGDRVRDRVNRRSDQAQTDIPVTVIPAQPRGSGRTWSPDVARREDTPTISGALQNHEPSQQSGATGSTTLASSSSGPGAFLHRGSSTQAPPPRAHEISSRGAGPSDTPTVIPAPARINQQHDSDRQRNSSAQAPSPLRASTNANEASRADNDLSESGGSTTLQDSESSPTTSHHNNGHRDEG
ncbi:hypothetical protein MBLNU230_g0139t1 [Neophaeotheca triangularis]